MPIYSVCMYIVAPGENFQEFTKYGSDIVLILLQYPICASIRCSMQKNWLSVPNVATLHYTSLVCVGAR